MFIYASLTHVTSRVRTVIYSPGHLACAGSMFGYAVKVAGEITETGDGRPVGRSPHMTDAARQSCRRCCPNKRRADLASPKSRPNKKRSAELSELPHLVYVCSCQTQLCAAVHTALCSFGSKRDRYRSSSVLLRGARGVWVAAVRGACPVSAKLRIGTWPDAFSRHM